MSGLAVSEAGAAGEPLMARSLQTSARPLIALATQLQHATPPDSPAIKQALAAAVARFERDAQAGGCDEREVAAASYLLCVFIDEVVAQSPWGGGDAGLLARFHGESDGSRKVLRLLSRLAEAPRENRALLELFHACLSLGFGAQLRGSAQQLETLRSRVYLALQGNDGEAALAPPWRSAVGTARAPLRRHVVAGVLLLALAALGVYTATHLSLARRVDAVFASMQRFAPGGSAAAAVPAQRAPVSRLAPLLAGDAAAGLLAVRDEPHRSVISIAADTLFERDSPGVVAGQVALLERVAAALATSGGKVLVIGHTDGADARTARVPSAWHQSYEWASAVMDALRKRLPPERLAAEGAADQGSDPKVPRRRVDVVLYP